MFNVATSGFVNVLSERNEPVSLTKSI